MKRFILFLILFIIGSESFAFNIVYPKRTNITINAKSTFFIGSSDKPLKINGQNVPLHSTGAFAYVVPLKEGINKFSIQSEGQYQLFTINKPAIKYSTYPPSQFKQYQEGKAFYVTTENAPLRSTPIDAGINRMAHLQRNILLNIDGEKSGFYRVILENNKYGWIAKSNVKLCDNYTNDPAKILSIEENNDNDFYRYTFHLNKMVPYEITEGETLTLKLFNTENGTYIKEFPIKSFLGNKKLVGYRGKYIGSDFVWEIRKPSSINSKKPLKNLNIAIDPGHGGSEYGAIGCLGDKEKDIVLDIAKNLEKELTKRGANVIMTRTDDTYLGLKERVDITNYSDASVFISIHANALPDGADPNKNSGTSVYYYYDQAKTLAGNILASMITELSLNNDKVRQASFAVVRNTNALSVLVETAYLINPEDNSKLISQDFRKNCAKAIADGVENYFKSDM